MALGEPYTHVERKTKHMDILRAAARLFAVLGYDGVSTAQVAAAAGMSENALYTFFSTKEEILESIYNTGTIWMNAYYERLEEQDLASQSLEETVENLFYELREVVDMFVYYAMCVAIRYSAVDERAGKLYYQTFYINGISVIQRCFERALAKGFIKKPFSTGDVAAMLMDCVAQINQLRVGEAFGTVQPAFGKDWFDRKVAYFISLARSGI